MVESFEQKEKVRAIIMNSKGEMIVCNCHGIFLLPGGKIEEGETEVQALQREIKEELGLEFNQKEIIPFKTDVVIQKNYPKTDGTITNREVKTHYYIIYSDQPINKNKIHLSKREEGSFNYYYCNCNDVYKLISLESKNPGKTFFDKELLNIAHDYNQLKDIDLHVHSVHSDGEYTKDELIQKAKDRNIDTLSISDHETINAYVNCRYEEKDDFIIIPGVEIGCKIDRGTLHILGYDFDPNNIEMKQFLDIVHKNHIYNMRINNQGLRKVFGICLPERTIDNLIREDKIGRVYMAKELVRLGIANNVQDAFSRYLNRANRAMKGEFLETTWDDAVEAIHNANGFAVLAHPTSLEMNSYALDGFVEALAAAGLDGIEVYNQGYEEKDIERLQKIAHKHDLYQTIGSDFHGEGIKANVYLGNGSINQTKIKKLSLVEEIKNRHK